MPPNLGAECWANYQTHADHCWHAGMSMTLPEKTEIGLEPRTVY